MPKRHSREQHQQERKNSPFHAIPWRRVQNPFAPLAVCTAEQVEQIHTASLDILEQIGLDFFDAEALDILAAAGARVDRGRRHAWLGREMVETLIQSTPSRIVLRGRNPERDMILSGNHINFLPSGGMAYIRDTVRGRRLGSKDDYATLLKLIQMSNVMHGTGIALIEMMDIPVSTRHLHRQLLQYTLSDKPTMAAAHDRIIPNDVLNMARLVFGEAAVAGETWEDGTAAPVLAGIVNVNSPLRYDERMLGGLISYARAGQLVIITPFIVAGAMSPITIAAALAQQNAEVLAGVVLCQLVRPGAPVLYGGFSTNADMRSGSPAFGTPESGLVQAASTQMARRYNLPSRGNGGLTNANSADAQAVSEALWTLWPAVMGHTNFIMHAAGWLETGLTVSLEKMMLDMENLAIFQHFLQGIEINTETLALDMMAAVGPGGHHFGTPHTQARYSTEFYEPFINSRLGLEQWKDSGAKDATTRARELWQELLRRYTAPPLDSAVQEALADYVAQRERELEGVNLYY